MLDLINWTLVGLLVSACVERAPEGLIGAAVADVGVHDLLKVCPLLLFISTGLSHFFSSQTSRLGIYTRQIMVIPMIHTILISSTRSLPSTMCQWTEYCPRRCCSPLIVRRDTKLTRYSVSDVFHIDDDRVVPMHSFKLAATLQHALPHNPHPLLLRVEKMAGHGVGKSTAQECVARFLLFLRRRLI